MPKSTVCCKKMIALKYGSSEHINNIFTLIMIIAKAVSNK